MKPIYQLFSVISLGIAALFFLFGGIWFGVAGLFSALAKWFVEDLDNA